MMPINIDRVEFNETQKGTTKIDVVFIVVIANSTWHIESTSVYTYLYIYIYVSALWNTCMTR